ncbi:chemotaxis-specific protein-glutamate methyltransferase CheB [Ectobacillus ponti]|uniref:Protein-glutamate methylesterase/protein-glutamine glutaminase n=1 Tax=Ectobacillus ponti TaxID=2961894 RepID=A0AA42BN97_9BACI|nr:chemotaxis-specific protein-glutamate methyltransferase CheB [Ectobacillus ponti]MCP8967241.1 chemotaxis-specific protein-glutamate methyltransferase CheB [Ectobacillus ponti]
MEKYRVLVVDDSAVYRKKLTSVVEACPSFTVVGIARNGADALEKIERMQPQLIVMDADMPVMDGLAALRRVMSENPKPVVVVGTAELHEQLSRQYGAVHFVRKADVTDQETETAVQKLHQAMLRAVHELSLLPPQPEIALPRPEPVEREYSFPAVSKTRIDLLLIGCSTGGPSALKAILPHLPGSLPVPVLVIQHMPPGFTKPLADRLNNSCALHIKEAEHGEQLQKGVVYVAPAGYQTIIKQQGEERVLHILPSGEEHLYKPSVDVALQSAAPLYRNRLLAVILTGMGTDGTKGCQDVKSHAGHVIAEAQSSCVVFGMPKSVIQAGYADEVADLKDMPDAIMKYFSQV